MSVEAAQQELKNAHKAWSEGKAGLARVSCRRAAGMALRVWIEGAGVADYGTSFMHHLRALADDTSREIGAREAAARLAARPKPEAGFSAPVPSPLTPMYDAELLLEWCLQRRN